jgi:hypothetical protein
MYTGTCITSFRGYLARQQHNAFCGQKNMDAAKDIHKEMLPNTHNAALFYRGTCTQGRRHLVTAATSVQSWAYRSLCVRIKLDSAAI